LSLLRRRTYKGVRVSEKGEAVKRPTEKFSRRRFEAAIALVATAMCYPAAAQNTAGDVLPKPDPPFKGQIGRTYRDSVPDVIPVTNAPAGAPNVLLILIDDCGYAQWVTFGGEVPTPNLDRVASMGLRYTRFHTTALSSPTRAALLTGRNHHSVGTGVITEIGDGYPGYTGQIPKSAALVSEVLRQYGYSTAWFGKNHNVPDWETSISGPFDRWPTRQGFDHFYGFVAGESNQWQPVLYRDSQQIEMEIPTGKEGHYTLNDSLADEAIKYIYEEKSVTPDRPFFLYYAPGATHAPHHVPPEWIAKFKGQFDQGWDKYREAAYQRQLKLGVIPSDTKLTSRPKEIPAYDSLTPEQKKVAARLMEVFAGYTAQTDYEVGRVLDALQHIGQLHNTLIFWIVGDNGASMEGTLYGTFNEMAAIGGVTQDPTYIVEHLDEIGGPNAYNHFPVGWAWAMDTPFQWGKQVASHFGGTRNPMVIAWPDRIKDAGGVRSQFHHVIDVTPTILEAASIPQPKEVNGVQQKPIEGVSMLYTFDNAKAEGAHRIQYFEMFGNRALYKDGWIAACRHGRLPWTTGSYSFDNDVWELYDVRQDFSEYTDVASQNPDKLRELRNDFWLEAEKYQVLPLDDRLSERVDPALRPSLIAGRTSFTYYPGLHVAESSAAPTANRSFTITADISVPESGADGVLVAVGGIVGGYTLYIKDGRPAYEYNLFTQNRYRVTSSEAVPPGPSVVRMEFRSDGGGIGKGGTVSLFINHKKVGEARIERTAWGRFSADETFDVGSDVGSPVSNAYQSPNRFHGVINKVVIDIAPVHLTAHEQQKLLDAEHAARLATE
jgi:arylsulfatase A-like enzyme